LKLKELDFMKKNCEEEELGRKMAPSVKRRKIDLENSPVLSLTVENFDTLVSSKYC